MSNSANKKRSGDSGIISLNELALEEGSAIPKPQWVENHRVQEAMESLKSHPEISSILKRLWQKDPYTYTHCHRVADLAQWLGCAVGLSPAERVELYLVGLMHDIGKLVTPDEILTKAGPLTNEEFVIMKRHPIDSAKFVTSFRDISHLSDAVRAHHERFDGKGYPDKLGGEHIHLFSRIIFVADTYDAMTTSRAYRRGLNPELAYEEILECAGSQFDPEIAKAFVASHKQLLEWIAGGKKAA